MFQVRRIEAIYDDDGGWALWRGVGSSVGFDHRACSRIGFQRKFLVTIAMLDIASYYRRRLSSFKGCFADARSETCRSDLGDRHPDHLGIDGVDRSLFSRWRTSAMWPSNE
jgi:hypothetical protein